MNRLYEYWDELYNHYGSALHDVFSEQELIWQISKAVSANVEVCEEEIYLTVFPMLLAAEDELAAETQDLMEGCYG